MEASHAQTASIPFALPCMGSGPAAPLGTLGLAADAHALGQPCVRDGSLTPVFSMLEVTRLPRVVAYLIPGALNSPHTVDIVPRVCGLGANIFQETHK